jgi:hypothetical protein
MRRGTIVFAAFCLLLLAGLALPFSAAAQISGGPSGNCHVTDGQFTSCANGTTEWSDVQPVAFPASDSFLYVNQDPAHTFLYLMYDFPFRMTPLGPTDSVHVSFDTVEVDSVTGNPKLVVYDIFINAGVGNMTILQQGKPTPAGKITGAAGFGVSPNSTTPHVMAELQVPLIAGPPSTYSPDPLFWGATLPPTPPPDPCPTDPGKTYNRCVKADLNNAIANANDAAAVAGAAGALCTLLSAATLCDVAEAGMIATALTWALTASELGRKLGADPPGINFAVPPDPNFTVIAQPAVYSLSLPTTGLTSQETAAFNAFAVNVQQLIALEQAETTALARVEGASLAGNAVWVANQMQAAKTFGGRAGLLYVQLPGLFANIGAAFHAAGIQFTFTSNDVLTFQTLINPSSPSSEPQQEYVLAQQLVAQQLGVSPADLALATQLLLSADPQAVASFGTGAFPNSLADPAFAATFRELGSALIANAPSPTSLNPSFTVTLPGDYVASGVGLRGGTAPFFGPPPATAPINITGIPTGASVVRAFLYWGMLDNGIEASLGQLNLNGTQVTGSLIGAGPDTCWGRTNSFTFRADVTPLVTGNGTYSITGFATGGNILQEGASLVVIYQLAGLPTKTVILADGNISIPIGTATGTTSFSGFTTAGPVSAATTFMVGDGQANQFGTTPVTFTGSLGSLSLPGLFAGNNGPLWDTDNFNVSSVVGPGVTSDTARITVSGDCLLWSAQAFSVTSTAVTTPVTATAAVVEAGANGDTVANQRGLAATDAPTLTDQIAMVVQFRTIQNPSISGADLTNTLVNGLVADGVISSAQATGIIQTVQNQIVPPTRSADTTPPAISCGSPDALWHASDVSIACTAVDSDGMLNANSPPNFTLTTNVPAGTETANVFTGTQVECDVAGNCATAGPIGPNKVDKKPPQITITVPAATSYVFNQTVASNYGCTDGGSGVATCAGPVANGSNIDTASVGSKTFTVNATDNVGNASTQSTSYKVAYGACLLYDPTHAAKSGSTIPIKFELCDAGGNDVSSSAITVTALQIVMVSTGVTDTVIDAGNANPDNNFRFDGGLGPMGGYIFNLKTTGLATGTYVMTFTATGDPTTHTSELVFQVR